MGSGSMFRRKKVIRILQSLALKTQVFELTRATKENYKIEKTGGGERSFPIASNHRFISPYILQGVAERLERWGVCSEKEFFDLIK